MTPRFSPPSRRLANLLIAGALIAVLIGACQPTPTVAPTQPPANTVQPTPNLPTTPPTNTAPPPTAVPPTPADGPKIRVDQPIRFAVGPLDFSVDGSVIRGERDRYSLTLINGETLNVTITSNESNAVFSILGPGQKVVAGTEEGKDITQWSMRVPADGEYAILVGPTRGNATYQLKVKVSGR